MKQGRQTLKITAVVLTGIAGLLAMCLLVLSNMDLNRVKPWVSERVSNATGREFSIGGSLSLDWRRPPQQQGWSRWVPWPVLRAEDIRIGNPAWATTGPDMAHARRLDLSVNPLPLLAKTIRIEAIDLMEPRVIFEKDRKGRNNWNFSKDDQQDKSDWRVDIRSLAVKKGNLRYVDPTKGADAAATLDTFDDGSAGWKLSGKFNSEKLSGTGKTGALLALQDKGERYPVEATINVGETRIKLDGTLTDPANPSAVDVKLDIIGASMADLFPLSGVLLPDTPKFSTSGRVMGTLEPGRLRLRYEQFKGKVGSSDIGGTLEFLQREQRPMLRGDVISHHLNFKDLGAVVGAGDDPKKQKAGEIKQPPGKVLPVSPFKTDRWGKIDVEVTFSGKEIIRGDTLPLDNLHATIRMNNGVLSLAPLVFGIAGGKLSSELSIDGRSSPAKARMSISARQLKLKQMFPAVEAMRSSLGQVQGDARLSATGNSFAALLGSANGEVKTLISDGTVSKFILEAIGLNVGSVVVTQLFGDRQVKLNCMATDFSVTNGLMQTRVGIVDTSDATIEMDGTVNFAREEFDLGIYPKSKGIRIISLRTPLYVRGTFKNPDVGLNKGVVALKAGAAAALGAVASPFAALLALINPGPGEESPCGALLQQAKQPPAAPPPKPSAAQAASKAR